MAIAVPEEANDSPATWLDPQVKVSFESLNLGLSKGSGEENFAEEERELELCPTEEKAKRDVDAL